MPYIIIDNWILRKFNDLYSLRTVTSNSSTHLHVIHSREDNKCCSRGSKFNGLYDGKSRGKKQFKNYNMTVLKCNSAVKTPVEYKKTVEYNLGKTEEKKKKKNPEQTQWNTFQPKNAGILP
jgi:hypothetical protein